MPRPTPSTTAVAVCLLVSGGAAAAAPAAGVATGASAPAWPAAPSAAAAAEALRPLEQQVEQMLGVARQQQAAINQMRHRLDDAEAAARWLPWVWLAAAGLGALAAWLGLRVRRLKGELAEARPAALAWPAAVDVAPVADDGPLLGRGTPTVAGAMPAAGGDTPATATSPLHATGVVGGTGGRADDPAVASLRAASAEELLDLELQAEFFLVLDQPQSAIELLLAHVRSTGGLQAQPYFKLLEIYRQQGDEEAYERTRERFNQRFNALAPDWPRDLDDGRGLEDYPELLARLQRVWPQPLRAAAELDALLLRRADLEPLDLPAYRELLMLHTLLRELPARAVADDARTGPAGGVDLLLPLDDGGGLDITRPRPMLLDAERRERSAGWMPQAVGPNTTLMVHQVDLVLGDDAAAAGAALDLDLSERPPAPRDVARLDLAEAMVRPSQRAGFDDSDLLPPAVLTDPRR